jgi:quinol monooxygenase YgiN
VRPGAETEFRLLYGPNGTWVRLFRQAPGYLETRLLQDLDQPGRFVTIDRWADQAAFAAFRRRFAREFEELDTRCAALTEHEAELGRFEERP